MERRKNVSNFSGIGEYLDKGGGGGEGPQKEESRWSVSGGPSRAKHGMRKLTQGVHFSLMGGGRKSFMGGKTWRSFR